MEPLLPGTWVWRQNFNRAEGVFATWFCLSRCPLPELAAARSQFLAPAEEAYYQTLRVDARRRSFLIGRLCVKEALAVCLGSPERSSWEVSRGVFQQPVLQGPGIRNLQASLSHSGDYGVAVVHPEGHPVGVDIEEINPDRRETVQTQMTPGEVEAASALGGTANESLMLMWSAKEALSKILRTGLMTPFSVYEMEGLARESGCLLGFFKNFGQYRAITFPMQGMALALALPKRSELDCALAEFRQGWPKTE